MSVCSHLVLPYNARSVSSCSACGRAWRKESSYPRRSLMHRGNRGSQTNAQVRPLPCSSFRRDLSIQPGHTPVATIIGEIVPSLSGTVRTVAVVGGMVLDVAKAAPLPEAKPNDVGFSQQVWPGWTISSPARRPLNVCPARWSPSHATISSSTTRVRPVRFDKRYADSARCRIRTRVHDQANGGGRWADAPGARP